MRLGGLIAGAVGGATESMMAQSKADRADQMLQEGEQRRALLRREEAEYEMNRKLQLEEGLAKKDVEDYAKITSGGKAIGDNRDIGKATSRAPSMDQAALDAVRSSLSPEEQAKVYGIQPQARSGMINDQITAAREVGARAGIRGELSKSYESAVDNEAQAKTLALKEQRLEDQRLDSERRADQRDRQITGALSRGGGGSGGGASEGSSRFTVAINSAQRNLNIAEEKLAASFRKPTPQEQTNPTKAQAYEDAKRQFINNDKTLTPQRERLDNLLEREAKALFPDAPKGKPVEPAPQSPAKPKAVVSKKGPPVGTIENGYRFKGGENIESNWVKIK